MKTLILKELRENLKLAVVGLVLSVAVVVGTQCYYINLIQGIAAGISSAQNYYYRLQPLTSGNFEGLTSLLCALVGVSLGWFQIHNERHRDLWAFLVHRPVTRTTIFLSKAIAGLGLYALTVGLPLLYFVLWVKAPGHVAAPFEWSMAWRPLAVFLSGFAWYFAGMLTSLRQARWYGSRALGLATALMATVAVYGVMSFWLAALVTVTLALAVWGAFHNHGQFQGQPVVGKAALALSLTPGTGLAVLGSIALLLEIGLGLDAVTTWPCYTMGRDGVIYKVTQGNSAPPIVSLDGQPLKDPDTGKPIEVEKFNRNFALGGVATTAAGKGLPVGPGSEWFHVLSGNRHTLWFSLNRTGRIAGFDVRTRRFIGTLGPDGFVTNENGDGSGFLPSNQWQPLAWYDETPEPMASTNTLYQVDLENRSVKPLWSVAGGDRIEAWDRNFGRQSTVVLTRHDILFFHFPDTSGKPLWSTPFAYSGQDYSTVTVYEFHHADEPSFSVWIAPSFWANFETNPKTPTHVLWLSGDGEITKRQDLAPLEPRRPPEIAERILATTLPPVVGLTAAWLRSGSVKQKIDWHSVLCSFALGALCVPVGFWLGRRYSFSPKRQATWALFNLFFGVPGLLAFVSVQEWPARERCAGCGKLRVVENQACEHCGSAFPPPEKNGTEIFEVLGPV